MPVNDYHVLHVELYSDGRIHTYDLDSGGKAVYGRDDIPTDIAEKLAVLRMMRIPPTAVVEGIGEKITENKYWVYLKEWG